MLAGMARQLHELQLQQGLLQQEQQRLQQLQQHFMDETRIFTMKLQSICGVGSPPTHPCGGATLASQPRMTGQPGMPALHCYPLMGVTGICGTLPSPMESSMGPSTPKESPFVGPPSCYPVRRKWGPGCQPQQPVDRPVVRVPPPAMREPACGRFLTSPPPGGGITSN